MVRPQILICDDDSTFHLAVKHALKSRFDCKSAYNGDEALAILRKQPVDIVLLDIQMRTTDEGLQYIPKIRDMNSDAAIVMSSGLSDFASAREAMRLGANDYVVKDFDPDDLEHALDRILENRRLLRRTQQQGLEVARHQKRHALIGNTSTITALRRTIEKVRESEINVIIMGETGTGKEVVARQLRKTLQDGSFAPFVAVDSATIQSTTAESQLFGHEKGAFTGADQARRGLFEEADGGIIYFDEIANMPLEIQAKLLRVLQEKEITRLGSSRVIPLEFRVVCATNRDLEEMIRAGQFKDDLYQRLNVIPIELPPLRDRQEDVPDLIAHFIRLNGYENRIHFTDDALSAMKTYSWPGNVRELSNTVAYILTMAEGPEIEIADLPPKIRGAHCSPSNENTKPSSAAFYDQVEAFEKELLEKAYAEHSGKVSQMALALGMDRSHLYSKLRQYGLHKRSKSKNED